MGGKIRARHSVCGDEPRLEKQSASQLHAEVYVVLLAHAGFPYTASADRQADPCRKTRSAVCVRSTLTVAAACPALSFAVTSYGAARGTKDDVVTEEDSADLEAAGGFIYRTLNGGGHLSIVQLSPVKHPGHAAWRRAFLNVLTAAGDAIPGDAVYVHSSATHP